MPGCRAILWAGQQHRGSCTRTRLGKARVASLERVFSWLPFLSRVAPSPPAGRWNIQNLTVNSKQSL